MHPTDQMSLQRKDYIIIIIIITKEMFKMYFWDVYNNKNNKLYNSQIIKSSDPLFFLATKGQKIGIKTCR